MEESKKKSSGFNNNPKDLFACWGFSKRLDVWIDNGATHVPHANSAFVLTVAALDVDFWI